MGLAGADQWRTVCPQLTIWAPQSAASFCTALVLLSLIEVFNLLILIVPKRGLYQASVAW